MDLAGARDVAVADLAARDNAVLSLHYILKAGNAALRDEFIAIGGIQVTRGMRGAGGVITDEAAAQCMTPPCPDLCAGHGVRAVRPEHPSRGPRGHWARPAPLAPHEGAGGWVPACHHEARPGGGEPS